LQIVLLLLTGVHLPPEVHLLQVALFLEVWMVEVWVVEVWVVEVWVAAVGKP
jgi:hypothetical protein